MHIESQRHPAPAYPESTRVLTARFLDRQADLQLSLGRHVAAERLAELAAEMRTGVER